MLRWLKNQSALVLGTQHCLNNHPALPEESLCAAHGTLRAHPYKPQDSINNAHGISVGLSSACMPPPISQAATPAAQVHGDNFPHPIALKRKAETDRHCKCSLEMDLGHPLVSLLTRQSHP
jgi:hypothetical protein